MWGGSADARPFLLRFSVIFIFLNREYVEIRRRGDYRGCSGSGGLCLIAIVHFNTPKLDVWTFIAPEIRSDGEEIRRSKSTERTWVVE